MGRVAFRINRSFVTAEGGCVGYPACCSFVVCHGVSVVKHYQTVRKTSSCCLILGACHSCCSLHFCTVMRTVEISPCWLIFSTKLLSRQLLSLSIQVTALMVRSTFRWAGLEGGQVGFLTDRSLTPLGKKWASSASQRRRCSGSSPAS